MNPILAQAADGLPTALMTSFDILILVAHSIALGLFLMIVTVFTSIRNGTKSKGSNEPLSPADVLFNSSNVLYLCVGMTSVMLLVNNNLARAFAIGAAIALVRFRIKMDSKNFAMCLFYGVIIGMACGVDQLPLAYGLSLVFAVLQIAILIVAKNMARENENPATTLIVPPTKTESKVLGLTSAVDPSTR